MMKLHFSLNVATLQRSFGDRRHNLETQLDFFLDEPGTGPGFFGRNDLPVSASTRWIKPDQNPDAFFTTMFDLYALPADFPGYEDARAIGDPWKRVAVLENAVLEYIRDDRLIPHIQLYEFETLIFADPDKLEWNFLEHDGAIRSLMKIASGFASPELIDDGDETAPPKRIIRAIPEYADMKVSAGPLVVEKIGLASLREKCGHFSDWLTKLERLAL